MREAGEAQCADVSGLQAEVVTVGLRSQREFIRGLLMHEIPALQVDSQPAFYLRCVLIGSSIEMLGAVLDPDLRDGPAFDLAIRVLFADAYHVHRCRTRLRAQQACEWKSWGPNSRVPSYSCLYHGWRCKGAHQLRPFGVGFSHADETRGFGWKHLDVLPHGTIVLVAETLAADFVNACAQLLACANPDVQARLEQPYLTIPRER